MTPLRCGKRAPCSHQPVPTIGTYGHAGGADARCGRAARRAALRARPARPCRGGGAARARHRPRLRPGADARSGSAADGASLRPALRLRVLRADTRRARPGVADRRRLTLCVAARRNARRVRRGARHQLPAGRDDRLAPRRTRVRRRRRCLPRLGVSAALPARRPRAAPGVRATVGCAVGVRAGRTGPYGLAAQHPRGHGAEVLADLPDAARGTRRSITATDCPRKRRRSRAGCRDRRHAPSGCPAGSRPRPGRSRAGRPRRHPRR